MKGFTLIELLIVIGIIAILAAGIIIAINPGAQFATTRDVVRESHIKTTHQGLISYVVGKQGELNDLIIPGEWTEICNPEFQENCGELVNLSALVSEGFISRIPVDPRGGIDPYGTGYFIFRDISTEQIGIKSEKSETRDIAVGPTIFECGDEVTFTYREGSVTYGTVEGENETCWMDRNLGAERVAEAHNDSQSYGHLFQWGRLDDGHQLRNSSLQIGPVDSDTPGDKFITLDNLFNWRDPANDDLWQDDNGTILNNPCPQKWRVPTREELESEMNSWTTKNRDGAFGSNLKLSSSGIRDHDGIIKNEGDNGAYWSSYVHNGFSAVDFLTVLENDAGISATGQVSGIAVRCIKN